MQRFAILVILAAALAASACGEEEPTPSPTPPYGLPPLSLPADESPHDFQTEWWYFSVHLSSEHGERFALHDVVFQVQEVASSRTLYIRHAGLADAATGAHETSERVRLAPEPLASEAGAFRIEFGDAVVAGDNGESYRLTGRVGGTAYDLTLQSEADPLAHHDDGLVDFREAGITYYYSRPRLAAAGTVTPAGGAAIAVVGLGWFDKQWGNFQPVAVGWDWASAQLDSGADLMLTRLFDGDQRVIDAYATLRQPGAAAMLLAADDFVFTPLSGSWTSPRTGTAYPTRWRVAVPGEGIAFDLEPLSEESEFVSSVVGVTYWEAGMDAVDAAGARVGQGFVELNWPPGSGIADAAR